MKPIIFFVAVTALSCQRPSTEAPPLVPLTPTSAATTAPVLPAATRPAAALSAPFVDPLPRWRDFLTERFGSPPGPALTGDFNGDGALEVATQIGASLIVFADLTPDQPTTWLTLDGSEGFSATVKDAAWAIKEQPALAGLITEKQSVLVVGDRAPLINFWHAKEGCFAWLQVIPPALEPLRVEAEKVSGPAFSITKNNLYGEKAFYGEEFLVQGFVGDFDADGTDELIVADSKNEKIYLYKAGAKPKAQRLSYTGPKAALYRNPKPLTLNVPYGSDDTKPGPYTIKGDYVEVWMPEKSGAFIVLDKGKWKTLWMSD